MFNGSNPKQAQYVYMYHPQAMCHFTNLKTEAGLLALPSDGEQQKQTMLKNKLDVAARSVARPVCPLFLSNLNTHLQPSAY